MIFDLILLIFGVLFVFILPGFLILENFYKETPLTFKIPLYVAISTVVSTFTVYVSGLIFGLSRETIFFVILPFLIWFIADILLRSKRVALPKFSEHPFYYLGALVTFASFFYVLYFSFFYNNGKEIIMAGDNWQDGALHLSISESISQGNFPPVAPYISGKILSYYYFADLESSILEILYGGFLPRTIVFINPFYASVLFLSVYAFCHEVFKNKKAATFAAVLSVYGGNLMLLRFVEDYYAKATYGGFIQNITGLLAAKTYVAEYPLIMQVPSISNYLMQNRPMAVGLPIFVCIVYLSIRMFRNISAKDAILTGILTAAMFKFQAFVSISVGLILVQLTLMSIIKQGWRKPFKVLFYFGAAVGTFLLLQYMVFSTDTEFLKSAFLNNFHWGPWDFLNTPGWYFKFALMNFNIVFLLWVLFLVFLIFKKTDTHIAEKAVFGGGLLLIYLIPHILTFTIYEIDMFKFFALFFVLASIPAGYMFSKVLSKKYLTPFAIILLIVFCSNSLLDLGNNIFNRNQGYSLSDLETGLWVREYTPKKSVFVTYGTVHSPVTDIGGRLRIMAYVNWPFTHGYNSGEDNVFARLKDIDDIYNNIESSEVTLPLIRKYNAKYIYYGPEERSQYPGTDDRFIYAGYLRKVYSKDMIDIYEVKS